MKRFAFFAASAVMFVCSISVFAVGQPGSATKMDSGISVSDLAATDQQWVGKTADQLTEKAGSPAAILVAHNGDKVYVYDQQIPRDGRAPERTLQVKFEVTPDGSIASASAARF